MKICQFCKEMTKNVRIIMKNRKKTAKNHILIVKYVSRCLIESKASENQAEKKNTHTRFGVKAMRDKEQVD